MPLKTRLLIAAAPVGLVILLVGSFTLDQVASAGEVARNVSAGGVALGGLGQEDAAAALRAYEDRLLAPLDVRIKNTRFTLDPVDVGVGIDEKEIVAEAMRQRRDSGLIGRFLGWFSSFSDQRELDVVVSVDDASIEATLDEWELAAIDDAAFEGGVQIVNGRALPDYPRAGEGIDRVQGVRLLAVAVRSPERATVVVPTRTLQPELTKDAIDEATDEANRLIDGTVTLTAQDPELEVVFPAEDLAAAFTSHVEQQSGPAVVQGFDPAAVERIVAQFRDQIEQPPRDARFVINDDETVTVEPSRSQTVLDVALVVEALEEAALSRDNSGEFPFAFGREPRFTTEDAEAMGDIHRVSAWTTEYTAGEPRVTNIQLIADTLDGAIVEPGEEFSVNEFVGQRTEAKGYVNAPMILAGEFVDDIGGGVSQFATTIYNAVFYGCYEDIEHKPHSYYFSRYPEVSEATISWPGPDVRFRNNTDAVVIVDTSHTSTSVTVKFFGNNGGKECERELGTRHNFRDPPTTYEADASVDPNDEVVVSSGVQGWTNDVKRLIHNPDGSTDVEEWSWTYSALPRVVRVHPCRMPDSSEECPKQVPDVVGRLQSVATTRLENAGFSVAVGNPVRTDNEDLDGTVAEQSTTGFLPVGSTVTIRIYEFVPPKNG
jgi:vancomycin resistance protein YoaR